MGAYTPDEVIDVMLDAIANSDRLDLTTDLFTPEGLSNSIAHVSLTPGDGNGDFTIADGVVDGRRLILAAQDDMPISAGGYARHWVLSESGVIRHVGTCTALYLAGGTVDFPEKSITVRSPAST